MHRALWLCLTLLGLVATHPAPSAGGADPTRAPEGFPPLLSETGFFGDVAAKTLVDDFVPYEINVPAWADGATKDRFFRLPPATSARFAHEGAWEFPVGTVFLQSIHLAGRFLETRVIRRGAEELSFATYVWDEDQREARLDTDGAQFYANTADGGFLRWKVAPTKDCRKCHEERVQSVLGLTTAQLNRDTADGSDQLRALARSGRVSGLPDELEGLPRLPSPTDPEVPLGDRARSYLAANCSVCHRPGGNGSGAMDLRYTTPFAETGLGPKKEIVLPGHPGDSWIYLRMVYTDRRHMPNALTHQVDEKAASLLFDWVAALPH